MIKPVQPKAGLNKLANLLDSFDDALEDEDEDIKLDSDYDFKSINNNLNPD